MTVIRLLDGELAGQEIDVGRLCGSVLVVPFLRDGRFVDVLYRVDLRDQEFLTASRSGERDSGSPREGLWRTLQWILSR